MPNSHAKGCNYGLSDVNIQRKPSIREIRRPWLFRRGLRFCRQNVIAGRGRLYRRFRVPSYDNGMEANRSGRKFDYKWLQFTFRDWFWLSLLFAVCWGWYSGELGH